MKNLSFEFETWFQPWSFYYQLKPSSKKIEQCKASCALKGDIWIKVNLFWRQKLLINWKPLYLFLFLKKYCIPNSDNERLDGNIVNTISYIKY